MAKNSNKIETKSNIESTGYHMGDIKTVISVDEVNEQAKSIAEPVSKTKISDLA